MFKRSASHWLKSLAIVLALAECGLTHGSCASRHASAEPPPMTTVKMITIPAGVFTMGSTDAEIATVYDMCCQAQGRDAKRCDAFCRFEREKPQHPVTLETFAIDRVEVTVAAYRACVDADVCTEPVTRGWRCDARYRNWAHDDRAQHPVNCVTWSQAQTYCAWLGKRLPTEAEWERAARGDKGQHYPWGDEPASCKRAVMRDPKSGCGDDQTAPVGSKPDGASPWGVLDMAGNLFEWTADGYEAPYPVADPKIGRRQPKGQATADKKVVRGGSYFNPDDHQRAAFRHEFSPDRGDGTVGFRCAR